MPTPHYGQPRYRAIADELQKRIESGAIPPGTLLPAESVLTAEFRAARGTIRQAIAALREDGLVTTEHGRGTYVNTPSSACAFSPGDEPKNRREILADAELATLFNVEVGVTLIESEAITRINGKVKAVTKVYSLP